MEAQSAWDTLIEASRYMFQGPSIKEIILFFIVLGITLTVIAIPYIWGKISHAREVENAFFLRGRSLGLTEEEIKLLWSYARRFPYDPQMLYENKPLFERVVSRIIREDIAGVRLIPSIRAKLRFDTIPWFIPLTSTRDIDLYQTGKLIVDGVYIDAAVWDKTETELHVVILEALPRPIRIGESVKFHFIRENEGRYSFDTVVKDKYTEGDRLVLVLEHTDNIHRVQLRESLRWKVTIPVEFAIVDDITEEAMKEASFISGRIEDISTKGVRICTDALIRTSEGKYMIMNFSIAEHYFENMLGQIVNVRITQTQVCMGVKFLKVSRQEEKVIDKFILEEQRKLIKTFKIGESE
ncbi:c-di-GMP-binding flagellar brake protein YcgR [Hydrogenivirga caldilitoris]|uniref:C-di-GMP-binding flagellar brake protein YcgR n=1 Tax=Hydrogenivirga caldilitoris TaxID=246264 RepID=A0A497XMT4_9AQUI|nr:PilZ domain-containing protein [Hydrogenivirga caldilitoris]RLJ70256.1 c-di-GMP-binding flagellar brake protein YcgR [Hydrogenivirga caldilitoris]